MFFTDYNPMTSDEIDKKIAFAPKAVSTSEYCNCLAGKTLKLKFNGEFACDLGTFNVMKYFNRKVL